MIIDFTITNFRSIKKEQTFSLYTETQGTHLPENVSYPDGDKIGALKSVGLYGANASGKSNLLLALYALQYIICRSGDLKEGDALPCYEPYLLSADTKNAPSCFDIEFFVSNTENQNDKQSTALRYSYRVVFDKYKIIEESLYFYPSTQRAMLFNRKANDSWEDIKFGSLYKGGRKRVAFFANNAYLSKAGNSADTPQLVRDIYNHFRKDVSHLSINEHKQKLNWLKDDTLVKKVSSLLSLVDTGITRISVAENKEVDDEINMFESLFSNDLPNEVKSLIMEDRKFKPLFSHTTDTGNEEQFEEKEESDGTRKLFNLSPLIFDVLFNGGVLIMDELDNNMHPFMAELIIKLFNDPRTNKGNAQLIFSTHNINLMSSELLRRDQIWFTEKQKGETIFYSLDDFDKKKVKPQSPFNQWYAEGRFGAIPAINYQGIVDLFNTFGDSNAEEK